MTEDEKLDAICVQIGERGYFSRQDAEEAAAMGASNLGIQATSVMVPT